MKTYAKYRDEVKSSTRYYKRYYPKGDLMYQTTEAAAKGDWDTFRNNVAQFNNAIDLKYFSELASLYKNDAALAFVEARLVDILYYSLAESHGNNVDQFAALMGNTELSNTLSATERKLDRSNMIVVISLFVVLLLLISFIVNYIHKKQKEAAVSYTHLTLPTKA